MICPGCNHFKFSPIHLYYNWIGLCKGRNTW
jgi:hypothetical protein